MSKVSFFFFFNDTATTEIYTLSLHDALPIFGIDRVTPGCAAAARARLAIAAGQAAVVRNSHRAALAHFRAAVAAAPDSADAQLARGETAEILGEHGQARAADGQAPRLSASFQAP